MEHAWQVFVHYFKIIAPWLVVAGIPSIIVGLSSYPKAAGVVTILQTLSNVLKQLLNPLSLLTHKDSPGTFKMPLCMSKAPANSMYGEISKKGPPSTPLIPLLMLALFSSSCACWTQEHKNDVGCVVVRQIIDCTTNQATATVVPIVLSMVETFISGSTAVDWGMIEQKLEAFGIRDAGCILASLEDDFLNKAKASQMSAAHAIGLHAMRERYAVNKKLQGVRYKLPNGHVL